MDNIERDSLLRAYVIRQNEDLLYKSNSDFGGSGSSMHYMVKILGSLKPAQ